jgi:hypothetical protein
LTEKAKSNKQTKNKGRKEDTRKKRGEERKRKEKRKESPDAGKHLSLRLLLSVRTHTIQI